MFDPNLTAAGHQPRGRDEMIALGYDLYKVHAAKIDITMIPNTVLTNSANNVMAIYLSGQTSPYIVYTDIMELGNTPSSTIIKKKVITNQGDASAANFPSNQLRVKKYIPNLWQLATRYNCGNIGGPQSTEYHDSDSYTSVGASPDANTDVFLTCAMWQSGVSPQGFNISATITYYTEWMYTGVPAEG